MADGKRLTTHTQDLLEQILQEMRSLGKDTYLLRDETTSPHAAILISIDPLLIEDVQQLFNAYAEGKDE